MPEVTDEQDTMAKPSASTFSGPGKHPILCRYWGSIGAVLGHLSYLSVAHFGAYVGHICFAV
jgi:hypothetical protein